MGGPALRAPTYDDVVNAPDGMTAEILAGELYLSPRPGPLHAVAEGGLYSDLYQVFGRHRGGPGGWWILIEPELQLERPVVGIEVAAPDVGGWRRERLPVLPPAGSITVPPDWVCEVLSPGRRNVRRDRVVKPVVYAAHGVPHMWIVDPANQTLEVYRLQGGVYALIQAFAGDERVRAEPFEEVELDISGWWLPTME